MIPERWQNQEEAINFALQHNACMLDMEMGTGKTRVAIDVAFLRKDAYRVLVVCPKKVRDDKVWSKNLAKFAPDGRWICFEDDRGTIDKRLNNLKDFLKTPASKQFVVVNYDSVWRQPMGDFLLTAGFNMVILDESHRAKAAGSKVSKYLAMLGKRVKYKMCLSGTPMANSPLDVYGQYRFLDPSIFGTNHYLFLQQYAVMGGPERRFVIGFQNQKLLNEKFKSIAYTCKMSDIAERIKLPTSLPPTQRGVQLPSKDMKVMKQLAKDFVTECGSGFVVVKNILGKLLRMQQIAAGFCAVQEDISGDVRMEELNSSKQDNLTDLLMDISPNSPVVVFCVFKHDIQAIRRAAKEVARPCFEISGACNELDPWRKSRGGVIAVQIQAGAEGIDMTNANHAVFFSLPHSLALYNQAQARLYRPGQERPVSFIHLIAEGTVDESMYKALLRKEDIIETIKRGEFDFGFAR